jgi:nicotinamidase-related amidase
MDGTAFLVLDMQRDFLEDGGRLPVAGEQVASLLESVNALIEDAVAAGAPVIYVLNAFSPSDWLGNVFRHGAALEGSAGAELDPRLVVRGSVRFTKKRSDAFSNPELNAFLRERRIGQLIIAGVFADACVKATATAALRRGYRVTVPRDAVAAGSDGARLRALAAMDRMGARVADAGG